MDKKELLKFIKHIEFSFKTYSPSKSEMSFINPYTNKEESYKLSEWRLLKQFKQDCMDDEHRLDTLKLKEES